MKELIIFDSKPRGLQEPKDIFKKIKKINIDYNKEYLLVFCLDIRNKIKCYDYVHIGGRDMSVIDPKVIFNYAIKKNASKIIIAHNHPSGNLTPSYEDIEVFKKLKEGGNILTLPVIDSIIFNKTEFYSMLNCS